jgi:hypothetical protein
MKYLILFLILVNVGYADNLLGIDLGLNSNEPVIKSEPPNINKPIVIADKRAGIITIVDPNTGKKEIGYALFGKHKYDTLDLSLLDDPTKAMPSITPAGIFKMKKMFSWHLNQNIIAFIIGTDKILAIHPVWTGNKNQQRVQRLQSPTPNDNRITNGCINVDPVFFETVLNKIPNDTLLIILSEKDH